jgi:hypothetical protein
MWPFLMSTILKPKVLLGIGIVTALFFGFMWYGAKREAAGYANGNRAQLEIDKKQFEQTQKQYEAVLQSKEQEIQLANSQITKLETQVQSLTAQFKTLAALREQQTTHVASLPDSQVKADLESNLGGPLEDPTILRKADDIVIQYPTVLKQVDVLSSKVDVLNNELTATNKKVDAITAQRDAAVQFSNEVVGYYIKAYNASQKHHSWFVKVITFGLVRDRHLNLPSPASLQKAQSSL